MMPVYPMIQSPALKETLWGGRKLARFGKTLPPEVAIGESWELADHPNGRSYILNGPLAGLSLRQLVEQYADQLYGPAAPQDWLNRFPLLVKIIDAADSLSVQLHGDDAYTAAHGINDTGKTECWVILGADAGAELVVDVRPGTSAEQFKQAAEQGRLDDFLVRQSVNVGDFFFIPAGRLHAIGAGILLAEFQQPSDTTFRVYDWGRTDAHGKSRPLHLNQSLQCINFSGRHADGGGQAVLQKSPLTTLESLADNSFFYLERLHLSQGGFNRTLDRGFELVMIVDGNVHLTAGPNATPVDAGTGTCVLLPAVAGEYHVETNGGTTLLLSGVPRKQHA